MPTNGAAMFHYLLCYLHRTRSVRIPISTFWFYFSHRKRIAHHYRDGFLHFEAQLFESLRSIQKFVPSPKPSQEVTVTMVQTTLANLTDVDDGEGEQATMPKLRLGPPRDYPKKPEAQRLALLREQVVEEQMEPRENSDIARIAREHVAKNAELPIFSWIAEEKLKIKKQERQQAPLTLQFARDTIQTYLNADLLRHGKTLTRCELFPFRPELLEPVRPFSLKRRPEYLKRRRPRYIRYLERRAEARNIWDFVPIWAMDETRVVAAKHAGNWPSLEDMRETMKEKRKPGSDCSRFIRSKSERQLEDLNEHTVRSSPLCQQMLRKAYKYEEKCREIQQLRLALSASAVL